MSKTYKCNTCKGDPRGVLLLNQYRPCPDCSGARMTGFAKDRAVYDLTPHLEEVAHVREQRDRRADDRRKERFI